MGNIIKQDFETIEGLLFTLEQGIKDASMTILEKKGALSIIDCIGNAITNIRQGVEKESICQDR